MFDGPDDLASSVEPSMCVHTARTVDAVDQSAELGPYNTGISHASIACMRVTPNPAHPAAENKVFEGWAINRISLPIPKLRPQDLAGQILNPGTRLRQILG